MSLCKLCKILLLTLIPTHGVRVGIVDSSATAANKTALVDVCGNNIEVVIPEDCSVITPNTVPDKWYKLAAAYAQQYDESNKDYKSEDMAVLKTAVDNFLMYVMITAETEEEIAQEVCAMAKPGLQLQSGLTGLTMFQQQRSRPAFAHRTFQQIKQAVWYAAGQTSEADEWLQSHVVKHIVSTPVVQGEVTVGGLDTVWLAPGLLTESGVTGMFFSILHELGHGICGTLKGGKDGIDPGILYTRDDANPFMNRVRATMQSVGIPETKEDEVCADGIATMIMWAMGKSVECVVESSTALFEHEPESPDHPKGSRRIDFCRTFYSSF